MKQCISSARLPSQADICSICKVILPQGWVPTLALDQASCDVITVDMLVHKISGSAQAELASTAGFSMRSSGVS
jgi:hypothetical protein